MVGDTEAQSLIRVVVADSTRIHSQLLADAMKRDRRIEVVGAVSRVHDLLAIAAQLPVDIALVGSNLDGDPSRGFELVRELCSLRSTLRTIMLLDSSRGEAVVEAFRAGARGIFSSHEPTTNLCKCVRRVHEGHIWANHNQLGFLVDALAMAPGVRAVDSNGVNLLSKRELDVVRCLSEGLTNAEIGKRLGVSKHTVKNYLLRIFDKMGVSNRMELLFFTLSQPEKISTGDPSLSARFRNTAEQGLPKAQLKVAERYQHGGDGPRDLVSAYMWCLIAETSNQDLAEAIDVEKRRIAALMTTAQVSEAERKAATWPKAAAKPSISSGRSGKKLSSMSA